MQLNGMTGSSIVKFLYYRPPPIASDKSIVFHVFVTGLAQFSQALCKIADHKEMIFRMKIPNQYFINSMFTRITFAMVHNCQLYNGSKVSFAFIGEILIKTCIVFYKDINL